MAGNFERNLTNPETGYNVVGVDSFEPPGEQLHLIGHYKTRAEAEKVLAAHKARSPDAIDGDRAKVYGPPGDR